MIFASRVEHEMRTIRTLHPPLNSLHEGLAVLQEEVFELQAEVYRRAPDRSRQRLLAELIQVAAVAQRIAEDLKLCDSPAPRGPWERSRSAQERQSTK